MKHIKNVLLSVYEKKEKKQHVLDDFFKALQDIAQSSEPGPATIAAVARIASFRENILTIEVSPEKYSPETHFYAETLRKLFEEKTKKKILRLRIVSCG